MTTKFASSIISAGGNRNENASSATFVSVWGSAGSGKTLLAINLAFELARLDKRVLLVDLDSRRPAIAAWLGLIDAGPGVTAALRLAKSDRLTVDEIQRLCAELKFGGCQLEVMTGLTTPKRWSEVTQEALTALLASIEKNFDFVVFDLNDEVSSQIMSNASSPSREAITAHIIQSSQVVLGTFAADPVGLNRFLFDCKNADFGFWPIANRVNVRLLGGSYTRHLNETLQHITSMSLHAILPNDFNACDASMANARPLLLESPNSKLTIAIRSLAGDIADQRISPINSESGQH